MYSIHSKILLTNILLLIIFETVATIETYPSSTLAGIDPRTFELERLLQYITVDCICTVP